MEDDLVAVSTTNALVTNLHSNILPTGKSYLNETIRVYIRDIYQRTKPVHIEQANTSLVVRKSQTLASIKKFKKNIVLSFMLGVTLLSHIVKRIITQMELIIFIDIFNLFFLELIFYGCWVAMLAVRKKEQRSCFLACIVNHS